MHVVDQIRVDPSCRLGPPFRGGFFGSCKRCLVYVMDMTVLNLAVPTLREALKLGVAWASTVRVMAGIGVGVSFVRRQGGLVCPLLDLASFRHPNFSAAIAA